MTEAANLTWGATAGGGSGNWDLTASDWASGGTNDLVWTNSSSAFFAGAAGTVTLDSTNVIDANSLTFDVSGYTITGGTLDLVGTTPAIAGGVASLSDTVTSVITGTSGLNLGSTSGSHLNITLGGANTYTGSTVLTAGVYLYINTLANTSAPSSLGESGTIQLGSNGSTTQVYYTGTGGSTNALWTIGGNSTATNIFNNGSGAISFTNTGDAAVATGAGTGVRNITLEGSNSGANSFGETINDINTGLGSITNVIKTGTGTWALTGANTYSGGTTLSGGLLEIGNASALGTGTFSVTAGGTSFDNTTGGSISISNPLTLSGGSVTFVGSSAMTVSGTTTLSGTGSSITVESNSLTLSGPVVEQSGSTAGLAVSGAGTLWLTAANSYSGGTTIGGGMVKIDGVGTLGASAGALTLNGGGLDLGTTSQTVGALSITAVPSSGNVIQNGSISASSYSVSNTSGTAGITANLLDQGAGSTLSKSGAGTLLLTGNNSYSGGSTISAGTVVIGSSTALGSGIITFNGATLTSEASGVNIANNALLDAATNVTTGSGDTLTL
ncbi:MAG TPA: autotransporter-associated beta strand repeat-containing protein, partial [Chthoniobacteraceae bacterium]|nr:autotransporter-associated beta strand repeat-containing protein [Chthoniobacteraceae bacterium]